MDKEMEKLQEKILSDTSVPETVFSQQETLGTSAVSKRYLLRLQEHHNFVTTLTSSWINSLLLMCYKGKPKSQLPSTGDSSERWWVWICVGMFTVISIINIWFAMKVSDNQFGKTRLIPYGTIFTSMYILFECFGILFISVISDLRTLYQLKKKKNCITNKTD